MPSNPTAEAWRLIANPAAGGGRGLRLARRAAALLKQAGRPVELCFTQGPGHAADLARESVSAGAERVLVCGGDGTVREVVPALAGRGTALGLLPFGTANDFARALRIPRRLRSAVRVLLEGRPQPVDLGRAGEHLFCTVAAFGFDAEVSQIMSLGQAPLAGTLGYLMAALGHLAAYRPCPTRLTGEFGQVEGLFFLVAAANTPSYGGGLPIVPSADPTDGRFDVCIVEQVSAWTVLRLLPRLFLGAHLSHPAVRLVRTAWLHIDTAVPRLLHADGEALGCTPIRLQIERAALEVVLPSSR